MVIDLDDASVCQVKVEGRGLDPFQDHLNIGRIPLHIDNFNDHRAETLSMLLYFLRANHGDNTHPH